MGMNDNNIPTCDGWCNDANAPTHIGSKGYIYCQPCAVARRGDSGERTRRMAVWELKLIAAGDPVPSYRRTRKPKYTTIVPTAPTSKRATVEDLIAYLEQFDSTATVVWSEDDATALPDADAHYVSLQWAIEQIESGELVTV